MNSSQNFSCLQWALFLLSRKVKINLFSSVMKTHPQKCQNDAKELMAGQLCWGIAGVVGHLDVGSKYVCSKLLNTNDILSLCWAFWCILQAKIWNLVG